MIRKCVLFFPHFHSHPAHFLMSSIFQDFFLSFFLLTLYSPVKIKRRFEGTSYLHFQGLTVSQTRKQHKVGIKLVACASTLKMDATCSCETSVNFLRTEWCYTSKDRTLHTLSCENLTSCILSSCFVLLLLCFYLSPFFHYSFIYRTFSIHQFLYDESFFRK